MPSTCIACGVLVDARRSPARIRDGRVVTICSDCSGARSAREPLRSVGCSGCGAAVPEWRTRTHVDGARLQVRCEDCIDAPEIEIIAPEPEPAVLLSPSSPRWRVGLVAAAVAAAASLYAWVGRGSTIEVAAVAGSAVLAVPFPVAVRGPGAVSFPIYLPVPVSAAARHVEGPAPRSTVHPLAGSGRVVPGTSDATFGAGRAGDRPIECGAGHCGIDLSAEVGTPVLAVREGVVVTVQRAAGARGGRWIQIDHRGGVSTLYFHLDEIRDGLVPGTTVRTGEAIATLGRTGVVSSPTHLHFAVRVDGSYVDPLPMIRNAAVVSPDRLAAN